MSKVLVSETNLTAIAEAIREKNGGADTYTPAEMAPAILALQGGDAIAHADAPAYVKADARAVAQRAAAVVQDDSIVFLAGSDAHESIIMRVMDGNLHAGMGMKALAWALPLDFACYLGDYTAGSSTTTLEEGRQHFEEINADIDEAFAGLPQFRTVGNHDPLGYSYEANGNTALTPAELYSYIGKYNEAAGNVMGSTTHGYCYRDFAAKKLRVICLNTAEAETYGSGTAEAVSDTQKKWFADTLAGVPEGYGCIILSHHPLDWGNIIGTSHVLRAYVEQSAITIGGASYSFAGKNKSAYVLQFHGHVHAFTVDDLHWNNGGTGVAYDVKRIAIPNMCYLRNNEYGQNGATEYYGIEFGEATTYEKFRPPDSDTAFCVCVVNPSEEKAYAFCYGAGYDREIYFGENAVAVTGITLSAASGTLNPGDTVTITATVTPDDATDKTVVWTSSDTGVAEVSRGVVTAYAVGTATITASTRDGSVSAAYALTVEKAKRGNLRDVIGYTDGQRLSTGDGAYRTAAAYTTVEYIDLSEFRESGGTVTIRTRGVDFKQTSSPWRDSAYVFYNATKAFTTASYTSEGSNTHGGITVTRAFSGTEMTMTITGLTAALAAGNYHYLRICGYGSAAGMDIRINEDFD